MKEQLCKYKQIYINSQNEHLKESTRRGKLHYVNLFLRHLEDINVINLYEFDINIVYQFINNLTYASQTKSGIQFVLREFFDCLNKYGLSTIDGKRLYPVILTNKRDKIPSFYYNDEVKKLIDSIDITVPNGVRDKCMILLAAQLGIRESDIIRLKFEDISWDKNVIHRAQQKTEQTLTTVLPSNLKYLLIDYIKNYRPQSKSPYIFLRDKINDKFYDGKMYSVVNKYLNKTDISIKNRKHGPHALRHSLATNLLSDNTPMPVITGILGHKNINTTSAYLTIDIETLRELSLEVPTNEE